MKVPEKSILEFTLSNCEISVFVRTWNETE